MEKKTYILGLYGFEP